MIALLLVVANQELIYFAFVVLGAAKGSINDNVEGLKSNSDYEINDDGN